MKRKESTGSTPMEQVFDKLRELHDLNEARVEVLEQHRAKDVETLNTVFARVDQNIQELDKRTDVRLTEEELVEELRRHGFVPTAEDKEEAFQHFRELGLLK